MFEKALSEIKDFDRIIIHRHRNPDGDAIGSQVGLAYIIRDNFPKKEVFIVGDDPRRYGFIPGSRPQELEDGDFRDALCVILDTSSPALISDSRYSLAKRTLRIDHHIFIEKIADTEVVETSYESCAGLVTELAMECGLSVGKEAATALYAGTVTDSGRFRFDTTSSGTFRRVSFLLQSGIDIDWIYKRLYTTDFASLKLKAHFIDKIRFTQHNVGYIYTTREELRELGISAFAASRGYVNTMTDLEGVEIWVAFAEGDEGVLSELRSSDQNINPIATKYGGGGHAKASGATLKDRQEAMAMLADLDEVARK